MADPAKLLSETIAGYADGPAPTLPPLRPDPPWWQKEWERWDRLVNEWWGNKLSGIRVPTSLSEAVPYICAGLVGLLLIWLALRWWSGKARNEDRLHGGLPAVAGGGDPLELALAGGKYAEAARLRWRRFLFFRRFSPPTTPREASVEIAALGSELDAVERLLFGEPQPTAEAYRQWDERLSRWEGPT